MIASGTELVVINSFETPNFLFYSARYLKTNMNGGECNRMIIYPCYYVSKADYSSESIFLVSRIVEAVFGL